MTVDGLQTTDVGFLIKAASGQSADLFRIRSSADSGLLTVDAAGNLGIGTTNPTNILTIVQNSATDPIADAWTVYSTPDSKIVLGPADELALDYLEKFKKLTVYLWKRTENEPIRLGVVATQEVPSEILAYDSEGKIQGIDLGAYTGFLHEVMKGQQKQIEELSLRIDEIGNVGMGEKENDKLTPNPNDQLKALEARIFSLEEKYASLSAQLKDLEDFSYSFEKQASVSGEINPGETKEATISGSLMVLGKTTLADLGVTGKITNGLLVIEGLSPSAEAGASIYTLSCPLRLQETALGNLEIVGK